MPDFRRYFMRRDNGHDMRFVDFTAAADAAAVTEVMKHEGGDPLELWPVARKVQRIEPDGASSK